VRWHRLTAPMTVSMVRTLLLLVVASLMQFPRGNGDDDWVVYRCTTCEHRSPAVIRAPDSESVMCRRHVPPSCAAVMCRRHVPPSYAASSDGGGPADAK